MNYILSALIGYMLGSIPTAYLIVKKFKGIDITQTGSKSVGAMNSFRSTNSMIILIGVFFIDVAKGFFSVFIVKHLLGDVFIYPMVALIFSVLGHNYSIWIKFNGGKGLAAAAGGALILSLPILFLWLFFFALGFLFRKNVHFANFTATILTGAICISTAGVLNSWSTPPASSAAIFAITTSLMLLIIAVKHIEPLRNYYKNLKRNNKT